MLRGAVRLATTAGLPVRAAQARFSLAWALALCGRGRDGLHELDLARPDLDGLDLARVEMQHGMVLHKLDQHATALEHYRRALVGFRRHADRQWEARVLCNRGILHAERGAFAMARADFTRSEALEREDGNLLGAAHMVQNLGWLASIEGHAPAAFAAYDRAETAIRAAGGTLTVLALDRIALLRSVALHDEARGVAERTIADLQRGGMSAYRAEAALELAEIALRQGDPAAALAHARRARDAFRRQERPRWSLLAELAIVRAAHASGQRTREQLARVETVAAALEADGWRTLAVEARVVHAELAIALGETGTARAVVARTTGARDRGAPGGRIAAWHAEALLRVHEGRPAAASRAVNAGLNVLEQHRAVLGATELRARAGVHGEGLARIGVRLALDRGDARAVLAAAERHRTQALQLPPVRPPVDPVLAGLLGELRHSAMRLDEARLEGEDTRAAAAQLARLERSIVQRARHAGAWEAPDAFSAAGLAPVLGERALLELVEADGHLYAVTLARGRARLHAVGTLAEAQQQLESLRFALLRLVAGHGTARGRAAYATMRDAAAASLEAQLAPALAATRGLPLVLVPTRSLHTLPWAALPTLRERPFSVAPSAALWQRAATSARAAGASAPAIAVPAAAPAPATAAPAPAAAAPAPTPAHAVPAVASPLGGTLAVAGPDLALAREEVEAVAEAVGGATMLTGEAASAAATLAALDGCAHAHIAAHGTFRADNPLFSSLQLADGPLTVFDLETLKDAPRRMVLFACDAGIADVQPGDELMGLTAALLGLGTATVVASVLPLPDAVSAALAPQLARRLAAGEPADAALAALRADEPGAVGLVCFGAG